MACSVAHDPEKWKPVSRLREALAWSDLWINASAGEGRSDKIMRPKTTNTGLWSRCSF
jgi:hypothetical protein